MDRKRMQKTKYLAVFATTTLIFIVGILVGNYFASLKLEKIDDIESQLKIDTLGTELQFSLFAQQPCGFINSTPLIDELHELGVKLDHMENILGKKNKDVLMLKDYYSILELRQWMLENEIKDKCGENRTLVLYFYSNDKDACPKCEEQGFILTYIRKNFKDVNIYSFDADSDNAAIKAIKSIYQIETVPTVVVNGKKVENFATKDMMSDMINAPGSSGNFSDSEGFGRIS